MTTLTGTTKAGLTVTTMVRVHIVTAPVDDIQIPGDWRMLCDRFDVPEPEPLRLLDDERSATSGVRSALVIEAIAVMVVIIAAWIWGMCQ